MQDIPPPPPKRTPEEQARWLKELEVWDAYACGRLRDACGMQIDSVYDLVNKKHNYPEAIPTLLQLLDEVRQPQIREGIVRALGDRAAIGVAAPRLIREFEECAATDQTYGWVVANSLSVIALKEHLPSLLRFAADKRYGKARKLLPEAFRRADRDAALEACRMFLQDPDTRWSAITVVGRLKLHELADQIKQIADGPKHPMQREAAKVLAKIAPA